MNGTQPNELEFRAFFADVYADALRFASRRTAPDRAEDAVAEAMLVAWRRFGDAPAAAGDRRAWLFGIVRNTVLNVNRAVARRTALAMKLRDDGAAGTPDHADQVAVASWTAEPELVSSSDLAVAETACREFLAGTPGATSAALSSSERRGDVVALLFSPTSAGSTSMCVLDLPAGAAEPREIAGGASGASGADSTPAAAGFVVGAEMQVMLGGETVALTSGLVGADVIAMSIHGANRTANATLTDGRFIAWFPGALVDVTAPTGGPGSSGPLSYDLTLGDGRVVTGAVPDGPRATGSIDAPTSSTHDGQMNTGIQRFDG